MKELATIKLIEIVWFGPYTEESILNLKNSSDYGLYQIYGTHQIFGTDSLLYIGKSSEQLFADRLSQHSNWLTLEQSKTIVYVGKFGSCLGIVNDNDWSYEIDIAEKLLVYHCSPPYNSQFINSVDYGTDENIVVLNFGLRHKLPFQVSTLATKTDKVNGTWKPYEYQKT
jgi:hypothetical protein